MGWFATCHNSPASVAGDLGVVMTGGRGTSSRALSVSPKQPHQVTEAVGKPCASESVRPQGLARGRLR